MIYASLTVVLFGASTSRTRTTTRITPIFITGIGIDPEKMGYYGDAHIKVAA